jgi:mono/diheme cytochrome c family protein
MPAYGYQLKTEDVWAVVHYVRALQRSQNASLSDYETSIEKEKMKKE